MTTPTPALPDWMAHIENCLKPFQKTARQFIMAPPWGGPAAALWASIGSGKTIITLSALSYLRTPGHILIVAPRNIAVDVWPQEVIDWNIPLLITSLNITPPGYLAKNGKPVSQRNLKPNEFTTLIDAIPVQPPQLYTVGIDRFDELVTRIVHSGPARTRLPGQPHPTGELDLDAIRDKFYTWAAIVAKDPLVAKHPYAKEIRSAINGLLIFDTRPRTTTGKPPAVVMGNPNTELTKLLKDERLIELFSSTIADLLGTEYRVLIQHTKPDYSRWPFPTLVLDEAQLVKNPTSGRWKALNSIRPQLQRFIQLSGTPSPEGPEEIWPQVTLLDRGATLGTSYSEHLEQWFTPDKIVDDRVVKWKISRERESQLHEAIKPMVISATNTELKLPGFADPQLHKITLDAGLTAAYTEFANNTVLSVLTLGLAEMQSRAYHSVLMSTADPAKLAAATADAKAKAIADKVPASRRDEFISAALDAAAAAHGDHVKAQQAADKVTLDDATAMTIETAHAAALRNKLIQFACGSLYIEMDKDHPDWKQATEFSAKPITRIHNLKLDKVVEICNDHFTSGGEGSILIAYRFGFEKPLLLHWLHEAGHTGARAYDGMPETKRAWNNGDIPIMLIHPASAGHGLNLQKGGHTLIWATLPDSNEHFQQTPGRLNRPGQTHQVVVHTLVVDGTIETSLPRALGAKQASQQRLLDATHADLRAPRQAAITALNNGS